MSQLPYLLISLEILEVGFIGSSLIHEVLPSSELKVLMLGMFFNAMDLYRAVGVILKIFSLESKLMGFSCLNHYISLSSCSSRFKTCIEIVSISTWVWGFNS